MLRKSIFCEIKPWLSGFKQCLLLLEVHTRLVLFFDFCCVLAPANTFLSFFSPCPLCCAGFTGVSLLTLQPGDDPLMTAVNLLEAN
jgi:hypothetical protein